MRILTFTLGCLVLSGCAESINTDGINLEGVQSMAPKTTSLLVERDGKVLLEHYFDGNRNSLRNTRSATKSVTMLAVAAAVEAGYIADYKDPIGKYFPTGHPVNMRTDGFGEIAINDLLAMTSALDCNDGDPNSPGNEENMYPEANWGDWVMSLPLAPEKEGEWRYCTAGVVLLGKVVEAATTIPIDTYIESTLLRPLGIDRQNWFRSDAGEPMTGGGLELTTRAYAALANLILDRGLAGGVQVASSALISEAVTVQNNAYEDQDYGYLMWHRDYASSCGKLGGWYMAGNGGSAVLIFPRTNSVAVVTRTNFNQREMHEQTTALVENLIVPLVEECGR